MSYYYEADKRLTPKQLQTAFLRDSTNSYELGQMEKISNIYTNPAKYYSDKAEALKKAGEKSSVVYQEQYDSLIDKKLPAATAHARALGMANEYLAALKRDVELDWPSNFSQLSLSLAHGRSDAAKAGFPQPTTEADAPIPTSTPTPRATPRRKTPKSRK